MARQALTDDEFDALWRAHGNPTAVSKATGMNIRAVQNRARRLRDRGYDLPTRAEPGYENRVPSHLQPDERWTWPREKQLWLDTGTAVVFSDAHYWPGEPSIAHKALLAVIGIVKPRAVFANGDVFDGGSIGRFPAFGWSKRPGPVDELHTCQERLGEIELAAPKGCELLWNIGNHCLRFERTLASQVDQFAGLHGLRLADHFPAWEFQWSTLINGESKAPVMVKHRYAGGIHAGYNNALKGGLSIITGHTHLLECKPVGDYRGRRWGVQTGSLADLHGPQFEYHENSPSHSCSGFAVLTFRDGQLMPPELCEVIDGKAIFRGEVVA